MGKVYRATKIYAGLELTVLRLPYCHAFVINTGQGKVRDIVATLFPKAVN